MRISNVIFKGELCKTSPGVAEVLIVITLAVNGTAVKKNIDRLESKF